MSEIQLEESLAKRYRQPKGVEQFGIEAIPPELKTVRWWDLFSMVINFLVNPGTIVVGGLAIAAGLSFGAVLAAEALGISLAFGIYVVMATIGVDYGIPGQVGTRMVYGIRGSKWVPSLIRTISSVYWFAFQTISGALGISAVLQKVLGHPVSLVTISLIFAIFQVFIATFGYNSLKVLSRVALPLKFIFTAVIFYLLATYPVESFHPSAVFSFTGKEAWNWAVMAVWVNSAAAAWFSMCTDAADFCRYSRTRLDMWIGTLLAAIIGQTIAVFIGGYAVAATLGKNTNPFEVMVQVSNNSSWIMFMILLYIILDNWTVNVLNLYTGGLSLSNIMTKMGRFWSTLIVSVVGVFLSLIPELVNGYVGFMGEMGNIFAPIAGVLVTHYVILKRGQIDVRALFIRGERYWFWSGFNWVAIAWTILGYIISKYIPMNWINIISTTIVTGILYWVTVMIIRPFSNELKRGSEPALTDDNDLQNISQELIERHSM